MNKSNNSTNFSKLGSEAYTYFTANTFITVIAIVLCFYMLVYFYNQITLVKQQVAANPTIAPAMCPDYWDISAPNVCANYKQLGVCRLGNGDNGQVDFTDTIFTNSQSGGFMKCKWAKTCGVSWQGIDNLC
jgi:hypothetical protein